VIADGTTILIRAAFEDPLRFLFAQHKDTERKSVPNASRRAMIAVNQKVAVLPGTVISRPPQMREDPGILRIDVIQVLRMNPAVVDAIRHV
jgi:hypothetical protein